VKRLNLKNSITMSESKTVTKYVRIDCALIKTAQKLYKLERENNESRDIDGSNNEITTNK